MQGIACRRPVGLARSCVAMLALSACITNVSAARPVPASIDAWVVTHQSCSSITATATTRHVAEREIRSNGRLDIPELGYSFRIPALPGGSHVDLRVLLNDRARGVSDHYIMLANGHTSPITAAVVVTELPADVAGVEQGLAAAMHMAKGHGAQHGMSPVFRSLQGPWGPAIEMQVPGRVGSACFPTSGFIMNPSGGLPTLGLTRFAVDGTRLLEFSLIVPAEAGASPARHVADAQARMDDFWTALGALDPRSTLKRTEPVLQP